MNAIKAIVRDRKILIDVPADWPEGCAVLIEPVVSEPSVGMREEDWPTTSEGIAALLQRWDEHDALEMTPEEFQKWQAARQAQKEFDTANFARDAEQMQRMWE